MRLSVFIGRRTLFAAALFVLSALPPVAFAADALPGPVTALLKQHRIPASAVSLEVRRMDDAADAGAVLSYNANLPRNPASVIKLLTTLAALELLGPGYHWQTAYLAGGAIVDGVLRGDLILQGGGDPFISVEDLLGQVLALRQLGISTIAGQLVIDNTRFAPPPHDRNAFDGSPGRLYNTGPDAALVNFSATRFVIKPGGGKINIRAEPPLAGLKLINRIKPRHGKCANPNAGWSYSLTRTAAGPVATFRGNYRTQCGEHTVARSIMSNTEYTFRVFAALWRRMGGEFGGGGYRVAPTPPDAELLLTRQSKPLADLITGTNKFSNNVMSRQLLLTLGLPDENGDVVGAGTVANGITKIKNWLADNGIAMPELVIKNGAGLSRESRASAAGLSALLAHGWRSTYRPEFLSSLPLAATDGTMRKRLHHSDLPGRARIKTGLIDGVRSMAGYVHAADNRHYSVVMMIDSGKVHFWNGNALQDAALRWVYERGG